MEQLACTDVGQRWVDRAIRTSANVPDLMASLASIEPIIVAAWLRRETKIKPVRLMTEDDLVQ